MDVTQKNILQHYANHNTLGYNNIRHDST